MKSCVTALLCGAVVLFAACAAGEAKSLIGVASYYMHGKRTANGERFNPRGLTAAHKSLPFGTRVRVTNLKSGRSVVVRINDRGPFVRGRIIDLAYGAAQVMGMHQSGVAHVSLAVLN